MTLSDIIMQIEPGDSKGMQRAGKRWNSIAKPLGSLGLLEEAVIKIAGIKRSDSFSIRKKAIVVMCADNGVVEEGVTQTTSDVTAVVAKNFTLGKTSVNIMAETAGAVVIPVDMGMFRKVSGLLDYRISWGTKNMAKGSAMTYEDAENAVLAGIQIVDRLRTEGYEILGTGEMGIGNTTTSSAVASVLLEKPVEEVTGKGAGLSDQGLNKKIQVIKAAIERNKPDKSNPIDVISKVGGLDIAGLTGLYIGGAYYGIPIIMDGFIAAVAALAAIRICPKVIDYILPSHLSKEPAAKLLLDELGLQPFLQCGMYLGEGTGASAVFPLLDMACGVYERMSTFVEIDIDEYKPL